MRAGRGRAGTWNSNCRIRNPKQAHATGKEYGFNTEEVGLIRIRERAKEKSATEKDFKKTPWETRWMTEAI